MDIDYFSSDELIEPQVGDLLISEPYLPDKNFERSVVLLCEHNDEGTFGLIINQPSDTVFEEIIPESSGFDAEVYVGGPVQQNTLHFIHRAPDLIDYVMKIDSELYYGGDQDKLFSIIDTRQIRKEDFRFFAGYSGWSPGQLKEELIAKSWI
ncbi:MAG: putative transcriptional regulator, partial [Cyclobacteriaceae bacterium]